MAFMILYDDGDGFAELTAMWRQMLEAPAGIGLVDMVEQFGRLFGVEVKAGFVNGDVSAVVTSLLQTAGASLPGSCGRLSPQGLAAG